MCVCLPCRGTWARSSAACTTRSGWGRCWFCGWVVVVVFSVGIWVGGLDKTGERVVVVCDCFLGWLVDWGWWWGQCSIITLYTTGVYHGGGRFRGGRTLLGSALPPSAAITPGTPHHQAPGHAALCDGDERPTRQQTHSPERVGEVLVARLDGRLLLVALEHARQHPHEGRLPRPVLLGWVWVVARRRKSVRKAVSQTQSSSSSTADVD